MASGRLLFGYWTQRGLMIEGLGCAGLVGVLALNQRSFAQRLMEWRPMLWLGRVSYSFYLYHALAVALVAALTPWLLPPGVHPGSLAGALFLALLCVAITIPMAWASFHLVERPTMRIGQRI